MKAKNFGNFLFTLPLRKMTSPSFIDAPTLAKVLTQEEEEVSKKITVVDVRDADFAGGNIKRAVNIPKFDEGKARNLIQNLSPKVEEVPSNKHTVVFHCLQSQVRGPKAAKIFSEVLQSEYKDFYDKFDIKILQGGWGNFVLQYGKDNNLVENLVEEEEEEDVDEEEAN